MKINTRLMQETDLGQVVSIENRWDYLSKWGRQAYLTALRDPQVYICLLAEDLASPGSPENPRVAGFAILALLIDHCELCNLVLLPEYLGTGVGQELLEQCLKVAQHWSIPLVSLEVRKSNLRAVRFYERNGFRITSSRKDYYRNPAEDAWVMERSITGT